MSKHSRTKNYSEPTVCYFCGLKEPIGVRKSCRKLIETHHIEGRTAGNEAWNRVFCCSTCHSKVHLGLIQIDRWYNVGYGFKLKWSDENGDHFGPNQTA